MLECKIGCLGPQRDQRPWAPQQIMNDGRSFALPITVSKNMFRKVSVASVVCSVVTLVSKCK